MGGRGDARWHSCSSSERAQVVREDTLHGHNRDKVKAEHLHVREHLLERGGPRDAEDARETLQHLLVCGHNLELGNGRREHALRRLLWLFAVGALLRAGSVGIGCLRAAATHDRAAACEHERDHHAQHDDHGQHVGKFDRVASAARDAAALAPRPVAVGAHCTQHPRVSVGAERGRIGAADATRRGGARLDHCGCVAHAPMAQPTHARIERATRQCCGRSSRK